jgi:hypothetical protein
LLLLPVVAVVVVVVVVVTVVVVAVVAVVAEVVVVVTVVVVVVVVAVVAVVVVVVVVTVVVVAVVAVVVEVVVVVTVVVVAVPSPLMSVMRVEVSPLYRLCLGVARSALAVVLWETVWLTPHIVTVVQVLLTLLEKISRNESLKDDISREGGIQAIVDIGIYQYIAHEDVVSRCLGYEAMEACRSVVAVAAAAVVLSVVVVGGGRLCDVAVAVYQHACEPGVQLQGWHQHDHAA